MRDTDSGLTHALPNFSSNVRLELNHMYGHRLLQKRGTRTVFRVLHSKGSWSLFEFPKLFPVGQASGVVGTGSRLRLRNALA